MKGGLGNKKRAKKYRNPWLSSEESEPEKVGSGDGSAEEIAGKLRRRLSSWRPKRWKRRRECWTS